MGMGEHFRRPKDGEGPVRQLELRGDGATTADSLQLDERFTKDQKKRSGLLGTRHFQAGQRRAGRGRADHSTATAFDKPELESSEETDE